MTAKVCNCPDPRRMHPNEVVQSKYPCPVHDTPERLAKLAEMIVPRQVRVEGKR
jgi:hypothetical protein